MSNMTGSPHGNNQSSWGTKTIIYLILITTKDGQSQKAQIVRVFLSRAAILCIPEASSNCYIHTRKFHKGHVSGEHGELHEAGCRPRVNDTQGNRGRKAVHLREFYLQNYLLLGWVHEHEHTL